MFLTKEKRSCKKRAKTRKSCIGHSRFSPEPYVFFTSNSILRQNSVFTSVFSTKSNNSPNRLKFIIENVCKTHKTNIIRIYVHDFVKQ